MKEVFEGFYFNTSGHLVAFLMIKAIITLINEQNISV